MISSDSPPLAELLPLRPELQIRPAGHDRDGAPIWALQDPVNNQFYRLGWVEFELLSRWPAGRADEVLRQVAAETLLRPTQNEIEALHQFLMQNQLLEVRAPGHARNLHALHQRSHASRLRWLLHHYLFFRVPLLRPAVALERLSRWLGWVYHPWTAWLVLGLSALGLGLTARQWDSFAATFAQSLSPAGFLGYLVALAVTKSAHELGHALTATRYKVRVAHMGVAFLVMWPMLYTDTTESWRLSDRRQRLAIASAGVVSELALAGLATLAWHLVGEGPMKEALFFVATTAWVISLTLNISPFMRFDGYFVLSDALDMPNLHERAFALARAQLRRTVLGLPEADPEALPARLRRFLVAFAWITWIYRLIVFTGIAIAVYLFFFKLLGLFLFAVEIWWFIARPVWRELQYWYSQRAQTPAARRALLLALPVTLLAVALWPWPTPVRAVAWHHPGQGMTLYSPLPARVQFLGQQGGAFAAGSPLLVLEQPDLSYRTERAAVTRDTLEAEWRSVSSLDEGLERLPLVLQGRALRAAEWQAEVAEGERLTLTAPFAGKLLDVDPHIGVGAWVSPRQPVASLVGPGPWLVEAFVSQSELPRLQAGATARYYPIHLPGTAWAATVVDVEHTRLTQLPHPMLAASHGGPLPTLPDAHSPLQARDSLYRVRLVLELDGEPPATVGWGDAAIDGKARSWLIEQLKPVAIVLIRELIF
ncbi:MAG: HlyD family efflux transporter periplasmic adaptor subunit [Betaproteobacteria bacterium]|nr:HlyD family efflux transporter periplasmic adaptor subunit [Betaproteobacteria bacterium]MCL2887162.1 HlyD family efflux transporter periplasmic adaptor subunit [Betaproteobacteria bacterium]